MNFVLSPVQAMGRADSRVSPALSLCQGFTLIELLIATTILAVLSVVAAPYLRVPQTAKLERAASQIADAARFARDRSILSGRLHGLRIEGPDADHPDQYVFSVFRVIDQIPEQVEHPVKHAPFLFWVSTTVSKTSPSVNTVDLVFESPCDPEVAGIIVFDSHGIPRCPAPLNTMLQSAVVIVNQDGDSISVSIESFTGRVTQL